jgi:hypothetical protein
MWSVLLVLACNNKPAETVEPTDEADTSISLPVPENGYQLVTPVFEVPAFTEEEICTVIRLEPRADEQMYWVNSMESLVTDGTHHMNVLIGEFSFLDAFIGDGAAETALGVPLGQYPCSEIDTMELAYTIFPSQRDNQRITMPPGVAAPMTAPLVAIFSHHYVNAKATPIEISAILNIETIPKEEVTEVAGLVFDDISDLEVPPGTDRVVSRNCVFDRDVNVALVSTHNHEWGECATINHYDGETDSITAEPFFVNKQWEQPPILHFEPETFSIKAGDGVNWSCHFRNDTDRTLINDGTADGEMCVFAAVTYPSPWTVAEVEETIGSGDLAGLVTLMGDVMGPCDSTSAPSTDPWPTDDATTCEPFEQTESNVLD